MNLNQSSLLDTINNNNSKYTDEVFSSLGDIDYDSEGKIIRAKATIMSWFGKLNVTEVKLNPVPGRPEPIDLRTLDWEEAMLEVLLNTSTYPTGLESAPNL